MAGKQLLRDLRKVMAQLKKIALQDVIKKKSTGGTLADFALQTDASGVRHFATTTELEDALDREDEAMQLMRPDDRQRCRTLSDKDLLRVQAHTVATMCIDSLCFRPEESRCMTIGDILAVAAEMDLTWHSMAHVKRNAPSSWTDGLLHTFNPATVRAILGWISYPRAELVRRIAAKNPGWVDPQTVFLSVTGVKIKVATLLNVFASHQMQDVHLTPTAIRSAQITQAYETCTEEQIRAIHSATGTCCGVTVDTFRMLTAMMCGRTRQDGGAAPLLGEVPKGRGTRRQSGVQRAHARRATTPSPPRASQQKALSSR